MAHARDRATRFRSPDPADAAAIWRLVRDSGSLDLNSAYAYLIAARHHAETCVVATRDGEVTGFVVGYRPPRQPDTLFVWQVAVAPEQRGAGVGRRMLHTLLERLAPAGVRFLEATVTPSNTASTRLFRRVAADLGVECQESPCFSVADFPEGESHEEERLFRIGPFTHDAPTPDPHGGNARP